MCLKNAVYRIQDAQPKMERGRRAANTYYVPPNTCRFPRTATYPTLHAREHWISHVAPIEAWESFPLKLRNVESSTYQLLAEPGYWSSQAKSGEPFKMLWILPMALNQLAEILRNCDSRGLQICTNMPCCKMSQQLPQNKNGLYCFPIYKHKHVYLSNENIWKYNIDIWNNIIM